MNGFLQGKASLAHYRYIISQRKMFPPPLLLLSRRSFLLYELNYRRKGTYTRRCYRITQGISKIKIINLERTCGTLYLFYTQWFQALQSHFLRFLSSSFSFL